MKHIRRSIGWSIYLSLCLSLLGFYLIFSLVMGMAHRIGAGEEGSFIIGGIIGSVGWPLLWRWAATFFGSMWKDGGVVTRVLLFLVFGPFLFIALIYDYVLKLVAVRLYQGDKPISYAILSGGPKKGLRTA